MVWFLAPTAKLCEQQHSVLESQITAVKSKLLLGSMNVDRWSNQNIWSAALHNIGIVVSTHKILLDALVIHKFIDWDSLSLIVFDEGR